MEFTFLGHPTAFWVDRLHEWELRQEKPGLDYEGLYWQEVKKNAVIDRQLVLIQDVVNGEKD